MPFLSGAKINKYKRDTGRVFDKKKAKQDLIYNILIWFKIFYNVENGRL